MAEVVDSTTSRAAEVRREAVERRRKRNGAVLNGGAGSSKGPRFPRPRLVAMPPFGAASEAGRQANMEDAVDIKASLCSPRINRDRPVHYFGVFDGHGGSHFAMMCKENLHAILKEELMNLRHDQMEDESVLKEIWRNAISRVFFRTEVLALRVCVCGSVGFRCKCDPGAAEFAGSTAVAVVLTDEHIVVGNCGDSRAVLYRGGEVVPLTFDHKPDRQDEKARIEASGGYVSNIDVARVEGILAMSRAIGDKYLKPFVISEPEVTFTKRDEEDEFLILGSDGMWDEITAAVAGRIVRKFLKDVVTVTSDADQTRDERRSISASVAAARLLSRLAFARGSKDNISAVVVDLKRIGGGK